MAKIILICGKICVGKTYFARKLTRELGAVSLSSDELMSALFHPNENDYHDALIGRVHVYLLEKAAQIAEAGADVILDWGFWTRKMRAEVSEFFAARRIATEWHYIDPPPELRREFIDSRNRSVSEGKSTDYFVDDRLFAKCEALFEPPCEDELSKFAR